MIRMIAAEHGRSHQARRRTTSHLSLILTATPAAQPLLPRRPRGGLRYVTLPGLADHDQSISEAGVFAIAI